MTPRLLAVALIGWSFAALAEGSSSDSIEIKANVLRISPDEVTAEGDVRLQTERHKLTASSVVLDRGSDRFVVEELTWTPCSCAQAPWGVRAERAAGTVGEAVVARDAFIEVCSRPVIPVPWLRLPLDDRTPRLMFPEVSTQGGQTQVGVPAKLPLGTSSTLIVTPEVWTGRGFRPRARASGPLGSASVSS